MRVEGKVAIDPLGFVAGIPSMVRVFAKFVQGSGCRGERYEVVAVAVGVYVVAGVDVLFYEFFVGLCGVERVAVGCAVHFERIVAGSLDGGEELPVSTQEDRAVALFPKVFGVLQLEVCLYVFVGDGSADGGAVLVDPTERKTSAAGGIAGQRVHSSFQALSHDSFLRCCMVHL